MRWLMVLVLGVSLTPRTCEASLDLGIRHTGISIGNSKTWRGLRLNLSDDGVSRIDGVNLTFFPFGKERAGHYRGVSLALGAEGHSFIGVNAGLGFEAQSVSGISVGGIGIEAGSVSGISLGLLAVKGRHAISGIAVSPFFVRTDDGPPGRIRGVMVGGGAVMGERITGLTTAGGFVVASQALRGIHVAGIGVLSDRSSVSGLAVTGGVVLAEREIRGAAIAGVVVRTKDLRGFAVSSHVRAERATGLVIAIVNRVDELHGVELGVLNFAGNNHGWRRWLPVLNFHR